MSNALFLNPIGNLVGNRRTSNIQRIGEHEPRNANRNTDQYSPRADQRYDLRALSTQEELIKLLTENRELRDQVKSNRRDLR